MSHVSTEYAAHPRPQLVRESWQDLNGEWQFAYDDEDVGRGAGWYRDPAPYTRTIRVPYPPESSRSGVGDTGFHPVLWYRQRVPLTAPDPGQRVLLHFGAVDYHATVWVNGCLVGEHEGGQTPFSCDVTDALVDREEAATLVVRAEDQPHDAGQPRGKQDWELRPHNIWYHRTSGIWQPVWSETVPDLHICELHWTPDLAHARVETDVTLNRTPGRPVEVHVLLQHDGERLAERTLTVTDRQTRTTIDVPVLRHQRGRQRVLWSPASPQLVDVEVELRTTEGVGDRVRSYLGLRSVHAAEGQFLLNGTSTYVRAVLAQGYWPESHLAAPSPDALRREVELIKELGFNTVRVHQKVEDPRFLYWCDRLGVMVWGEMANAYAFDASAVGRLTREWLDVVRRDRSHPSIVTWVPVNESWGVENAATRPEQRSFLTALYHLTKALDPSRPVVSNDGWEHTDSDIWTVHDYRQRPRLLRHRYGDPAHLEQVLRSGRASGRKILLEPGHDRGQPIMLTEYGGIQLDTSDSGGGFGYATADSAEDLLERFTQLTNAVLDSTALAGFCYTQLTDTEQERNGLLTAEREPKVPLHQLRRVITRGRAYPQADR